VQGSTVALVVLGVAGAGAVAYFVLRHPPQSPAATAATLGAAQAAAARAQAAFTAANKAKAEALGTSFVANGLRAVGVPANVANGVGGGIYRTGLKVSYAVNGAAVDVGHATVAAAKSVGNAASSVGHAIASIF
jgi:hypothetical protein